MDLIFHAQDTTYKSPFGAVSAGTPIRFQADLPKDGTLVQASGISPKSFP